MADPIRVLLADDQQIVRQGLATILLYEEDIVVVGQAGDGLEAVASALSLRPDVVLMDLKMPRLGGVPATRQIREALPDTHVIILTTYDADDLVYEAIKAGADGYLLKDATRETLGEAVRGVMRGESQLDPTVARKVLGEFQRMATRGGRAPARAAMTTTREITERLTPREEQVLQLLVEGLSNKEIATRLHLTEGTVRNHVSRVIAKLQANDRTQAVIAALRRGLVDLWRNATHAKEWNEFASNRQPHLFRYKRSATDCQPAMAGSERLSGSPIIQVSLIYTSCCACRPTRPTRACGCKRPDHRLCAGGPVQQPPV